MTTTFLPKSTFAGESQAITALVAAFSTDPAVRWMYPDGVQYLIHFPDFVRALGGKAFEMGTVDFAKGYVGAALWLAPGVMPDETAFGTVLQQSVYDKMLPEVAAVFEHMGMSHPDEPHWYLPLIGMHPDWQGNGLGSALLQRGLERCDREHMPAYLESTSPRNLPLYERFGFRRVAKIRVGSSPEIIAMVRQPKKEKRWF